MSESWWTDDDRLLAELGAAMHAGEVVPPAFIEAGKASFAWRQIDTELAELAYDSASAPTRDVPALVREAAPPRSLSFASDRLTIELELSDDTARGQLIPALPATVELEDDTVFWANVRCDEQGFFVIESLPPAAQASQVRLTARAEGIVVRTGWISR